MYKEGEIIQIDKNTGFVPNKKSNGKIGGKLVKFKSGNDEDDDKMINTYDTILKTDSADPKDLSVKTDTGNSNLNAIESKVDVMSKNVA